MGYSLGFIYPFVAYDNSIYHLSALLLKKNHAKSNNNARTVMMKKKIFRFEQNTRAFAFP